MGAISIVRITGSETLEILRLITGMNEWPPHFQKMTGIKDPQKNLIDTVMAVFHPGPISYTGEDTAEISCHGNPLLVKTITDTIIVTGLALPAERGEFTLRAYKNGKIDIAQAEAISALIDAKSYCGIEMAKSLMSGELSSCITSIKNDLEQIYADFEAAFILDELESDDTMLLQKIDQAITALEGYTSSYNHSRYAYSGIRTAIAGLPNAGKSSLFNAILGYDRAIVHEEEGTTRDVIKEHLEFDNLDFVFFDTAGLREAVKGPEAAGIEMTKQAMENADMVLYVIDSEKGITERDMKWLSNENNTIAVFNKSDLCSEVAEMPGDILSVSVSAKYNIGIDRLLVAMRNQFPQGLPRLFIERHGVLINRALDALNAFKEGAFAITPDASITDLKEAIIALKSILGEELSQDILDDIFSRFCIGK
jgi:tRNA modification GTPase